MKKCLFALALLTTMVACNEKTNKENKEDQFVKPDIRLSMMIRTYSFDDETYHDTVRFRYNEKNQLIYYFEQGYDGTVGFDSIQYDDKGRIASFIELAEGEPVHGLRINYKLAYENDRILMHASRRPINIEGAKEDGTPLLMQYVDTLLLKDGRVVGKFTEEGGRDYKYDKNGAYTDEYTGMDSTYANPYALSGDRLFWIITLGKPEYGEKYVYRYQNTYDAIEVTPYKLPGNTNDTLKYLGVEKYRISKDSIICQYFYEPVKR